MPHSKTVRGTLDNPKTKEAIKNDDKPRSMLGDPGSLKAESTDSNSLPGKDRQDGGTVDNDSFSSQDSGGRKGNDLNAADADSTGLINDKEENKNFDPRKYRKEKGQGKGGNGGGNGERHSANVRGTLGNKKTQEAIKQDKKPPGTGDPTSLKQEKNSDATRSKL